MSMPVITPSDVSRDQAVTDIIQSVALQEAALSHILNAEGEKMQAFLGTLEGATPLEDPPTPEELLEMNKSVLQLVNAITRLEMTLQSKLELFSDEISNPCPPQPV